MPHVSATTVYYTDAEDEHATAEAVGQELGAPGLKAHSLTHQPAAGRHRLGDGLTLECSA